MNNENNFYVIRGKSDRRRKRESIKLREKKLLKLYNYKESLYELKFNLGLEELEKPYQKGFKRLFTLRDDIHSEKQIEFYNELLPFINTITLSLRQDFKKRKRIKRRKVYVEVKQELGDLTPCQFRKLPEKFKRHFNRVESCYIKSNLISVRYIFCEPWRYELLVEPNMITHRRKISVDLESEIRQLENQITRNNLGPKFSKIKSKPYQYKHDRCKKQYRIKDFLNE